MPKKSPHGDHLKQIDLQSTESPCYARVIEELVVHEYLAEGVSPLDPGFVLVHGAMDRSTSMGKLARLLRPYPVVTYDRRGYAGSLVKSPLTGVDDLLVPRHITDLADLISRRPTVVFGHSLGGTIALLTAAKIKPGNLISVVVFESPLPANPWWPSWLAKRYELGKTYEAEHYKKRGEAFMRRMIGDSNWRRLPPSTRSARIDEGFTLVTEGAAFASFESNFNPNEIAVPVVSAIGEHASYRHRLGQKYIADHVRSATTCCITGSDHSAHLTHPKALAELCLDQIVNYTNSRDESLLRQENFDAKGPRAN